MRMFRLSILLLLIGVFAAIPLFADYTQALDLYKQGKYQDSLKIIADTLEVSKDFTPSSPNYSLRFLAAHNHKKLGNLNSAILHLQKCAEIKPASADPLIDLAFMSIDAGKFREAMVYAQKASLISPKNALGLYLSGLSLYKQGNFWGAKEYL